MTSPPCTASANKYEELKIKMEDDLQPLSNCTASIKLSINHEKTKAMLIKSNILVDVRFEYVKIDFVDNFKYLGPILDKDLTFSLHIKRLKGCISRYRMASVSGVELITI
jgi:hypothetical protein